MSDHNVSIVIRCYNEEQHIARLLTGILAQSLPDPEIILVDSGSTDGTLAIASQFPVRVVHIEPQQFTFGRSLNLGCSQAGHELIVIASAHVYPVYADWLERLVAPFSDPQVGLTYGKQRGDRDTKFSEQQIFIHWFPEHARESQAYPFCNNANAAIRRSLWQKFPYDETLSGLEDLDWARRVSAAGYRIAYVPEAEIIHLHNEPTRGTYNRYRREAMAFQHIYPHERFRLVDFLHLSASNILHDLWRAYRQGVLLRHLSSIPRFRLAQFWGTYQGYRQRGPLNWQLRQTFYYPRTLGTPAPNQPRNLPPIPYDQPPPE
jgi:rhamnosyltransferase